MTLEQLIKEYQLIRQLIKKTGIDISYLSIHLPDGQVIIIK